MALRVLIVDDHAVLRAGLRTVLCEKTHLEVVGEADSGEEALRQARLTKPDIILMDITMPGMNGLQATQAILTELPEVKVLLLTVHADESLAKEALSIGAAGYVLKQAVESELINAIHAVARGDMYIDPTLTRALLQESLLGLHPQEYDDSPITPREREVLHLIARGYTSRQIAQKLSISKRTVDSHRANIMEKLDLHSRVELVRYARQNDILD